VLLIKVIENFYLTFSRIFPPEFAKNLTLFLLNIIYHLNLLKLLSSSNMKNLSSSELAGITFKNKIGIAGGLDKNAEYFHIFGSLGFGFVEVGTVTLDPQKGNPKPRLFRFSKDKTLVNSLGFNNVGAVTVLKNIKKFKPKYKGALGVSIGKSKTTKLKNAWKDYLHLMDYFYLEADYLAVNISSPNTENLRELSSQENLEFLLEKISQKKIQLIDMYKKNTPIFVKLSPDETEENLKNIIEVSEKNSIDGFICCNTTTDHIYPIAGGMSGAMLSKKAVKMQKKVAKFKQEKSILIASGGVMNSIDVKERLINSADLVQLYTGYIYQGNSLLKKALKISSS
jgi:dihydroorotate dehydrogenase